MKIFNFFALLIPLTISFISIASDLVVPTDKDILFFVNGDAQFGYIEKENLTSHIITNNMPFGGSYACAYDVTNERVYIHQGQQSPYGLYYFDLYTGTFHNAGNAPSLGGGIPWLEFDNENDIIYAGSASNFQTINPTNTNRISTISLSGFTGSTGGGDLAFTTDGDLYVMPNSGLYLYTPSSTSSEPNVNRKSAEGLPYYLTSMAIDDDNIVWIATNDANSKIMNMDTVTGQYVIRKTFNHRINDLTDRPKDISNIQIDSDNDGVIDELDDLPNDSEASGLIFYPSVLGTGTLAFEDKWPKKGDYDFNDLVLNYKFTYFVNNENEMIKMRMQFLISAVGASFRNGFGLELPINKDLVESVQGTNISRGLVSLDSNGLEQGHEKAVIIVFDNAYDNMGESFGHMTRTAAEQAEVQAREITIDIRFTQFIDSSTLGLPPYNPFIFVNKNRGREVHLPGQNYTNLADLNLFNTFDDHSNLVINETYKTDNGLPWAINIPHRFRVPKEGVPINQAYSKFVDFAQSSSSLYPDWYSDKEGYRVNQNIYYPNVEIIDFEEIQ
jgi:LruC domain-containing protein